MLHFGKNDILSDFEPQSWQSVVFNELASSLTSTARPFPCLFGVAGFKTDQLRFAFCEDMTGSTIAPILRDFLSRARSYGQNTSLVLFSKPSAVETIHAYEQQFWSLLRDIALHDVHQWPNDIPEQLDDPVWEFCFAGEPVFVVCNTPAHVLRQSRRTSTFTLTFQPRWVFDSILDTEENANKAFAKVRRRLEKFDMLPPAPVLGKYGDPDNREYQQYFLNETNELPQCPFASLYGPRLSKEPKPSKTEELV